MKIALKTHLDPRHVYKLVANYLDHYAYLETLETFIRESRAMGIEDYNRPPESSEASARYVRCPVL